MAGERIHLIHPWYYIDISFFLLAGFSSRSVCSLYYIVYMYVCTYNRCTLGRQSMGCAYLRVYSLEFFTDLRDFTLVILTLRLGVP